MAALRTLITGEIAPVGQPVRWRVSPAQMPAFPGYRSHWTNSGTAALALAVRTARLKRADVQYPEVLLPAYGCPGLIAAVLQAGAAPVLVDIGADDPAMSARALSARWSPNVVAVVAVNFLGIRERIDALRAHANDKRALLIEDCAQWYPEQSLEADAVVLSFGRGKPVNLLGGGALLLRDEHELPEQVRVDMLPDRERALPIGVRAAVFNTLLHRHPYALAARLPGLALGETRFRPLVSVAILDDARRGLLPASVQHWLARERWREHRLDRALSDVPGVTALPVTLAHRSGRLLRYPLLLRSRSARDAALAALGARGLGASAFYRVPLAQVEGVPESVRSQAASAETESFAERLLTLPLHDGVRASDLARMVRVLKRSLKRELRPATATDVA
jgi:dTDP-4-amino-4,6-dideoxygalactose transaminase